MLKVEWSQMPSKNPNATALAASFATLTAFAAEPMAA